MEKTDVRYSAYIQILKEELLPAMGCTEPIAIAYGAAIARETLGVLPDRVSIEASGSIIKNVKSVVVPNTGHQRGIPAAAAAGIIAGDASKGLEVIAQTTPEQIRQMKEFLEHTEIKVEHADHGLTFDVIITLYRGEAYAKVRIANYHTNVVLIEKNGEVVKKLPVEGEREEGLTDRSLLSMEGIWGFVNTVDIEDVRAILDPQIQYNWAIAQEGIQGDYGANIGSVLLKMSEQDIRTHKGQGNGSSRIRCQNEWM